jgi:hypothetical protein
MILSEVFFERELEKVTIDLSSRLFFCTFDITLAKYVGGMVWSRLRNGR